MLYLRGLLTNYQKFLIKQFVGSAWLGHCLCPVLLILPTKCAVLRGLLTNCQKFLIKQFVGSAWLGHYLCPLLSEIPD